MKRRCQVEGCDRWVEYRIGGGLCKGHYVRFRHHGDVFADVPLDGRSMLHHWTTHAPVQCECREPRPGPNGECRRCHRLIIDPSYGAKLAQLLVEHPEWA